ncbi:MAG: hypothetical protein ABSB60_07360 [Terracidiphilus sp.]
MTRTELLGVEIAATVLRFPPEMEEEQPDNNKLPVKGKAVKSAILGKD